MFHFVYHGGIVQQGFGRDAAHIQAHAAQGGVALHNGGFQTLVGCGKGSRIATGAATQHHHIIFGIGIAGEIGGLWCRRRLRCRCGGRWRSRFGFGGFGSCCCGFYHRNHAAFGNFIAHFYPHFFNHPGHFGGHIHGGLVGFQCNQRVFYGHAVANFDIYGNDVHIFMAADIGYF